MDRRSKRTVISIEDEVQPQLDFEEAELSMPFTFPEYQRELVGSRLTAGITDFAVVGALYSIFLVTTLSQMPEGFTSDQRLLGIYAVCYLALVVIYFFLFMISGSQTLGMKRQNLIVVTKEGEPLDPRQACMRGFGYLISILPMLLGFVWMLVDPEHLTWADKVSSTYVKKVADQ